MSYKRPNGDVKAHRAPLLSVCSNRNDYSGRRLYLKQLGPTRGAVVSPRCDVRLCAERMASKQ